MLTINLLPPEEKQILRAEELGRIVRFFAAGLMTIFIVGSVLLSPTLFPLVFERRELERSYQLTRAVNTKSNTQEIFARGKTVRATLESLRANMSRPYRASQFIDQFVGNIPSTIQVVHFDIGFGGEVSIMGFAQTRNDLLNFQKIVQSSGYFEQIVSPLSNVIPESNINFILRARIKGNQHL